MTDKPNPNRSPRALPLVPAEPAVEFIPPEMQPDFFIKRKPSPRALLAYAETKKGHC